MSLWLYSSRSNALLFAFAEHACAVNCNAIAGCSWYAFSLSEWELDRIEEIVFWYFSSMLHTYTQRRPLVRNTFLFSITSRIDIESMVFQYSRNENEQWAKICPLYPFIFFDCTFAHAILRNVQLSCSHSFANVEFRCSIDEIKYWPAGVSSKYFPAN